jgi:hypothetical protein
MSLNLKICKKCYEMYSIGLTFDIKREMETAKRTRILACPYCLQGYFEATTDVDKSPPMWCPYLLEQLMSNQ